MLTFTLALQSLVNVGVRGSEAVRTRSVEAGVLSVAQRILCGFFNEQEAASKLRRAREEEEERVAAHASLAQPNLSRLNATSALSSLHTTAVPSRTATPDGLPSSSASSIAADDAAASSSDGEADEHYPTGAMSRRSRSATIKEATPVAAPAGGASDLPGDMELDRAEQQDDDALLPPDPPNADPGHGYTEPRYSCYREDDLLSCLQLLAYLSKYPHVRVAFHHPALDFACGDAAFLHQLDAPAHKEALLAALNANATPSRSTNVFSLVERYTVRPSSTDKDRSPPTPLRYLPDVGYWAGVIMRNACRKDEHRGGIRQCANMACGAWETYPREFAKCRRCRKAKYCSKVCQSAAWQGGHRYILSYYILTVAHPSS